MSDLKQTVEYFTQNSDISPEAFKVFSLDFINALNTGTIRSAEPTSDGNWVVNTWVKQGILLLFKHGNLIEMRNDGSFSFFDKDTLPTRKFSVEDKVRIVPGGSTIRTGAYVAKGVICMPPMYINIGAYVDEGSMIDSHALVGTCAQIGKNVHISAAAQIGGVLEPAGAQPVIVEDNVMIGGNVGVYEGVRVRSRAVLASGVVLTASTKVYDLVNEKIITSTENSPLEIPQNAVVISGTRSIQGDFAAKNGLSIYTPLIVKYRDEKTDAKTALNDILR